MEVSEQEALEIALIENLQRKDLTPFEEAEGYRALAERHGYTHEEIAEAVGKSRTVVTESLALLQMPAAGARHGAGPGDHLEIPPAGGPQSGQRGEMIRLLEEVSRQGLNRDDLRRRSRPPAGGRRKPYVFKFRSPDKTYRLNLAFRRSTVDRQDLIAALQEILQQLVAEQQQQA